MAVQASAIFKASAEDMGSSSSVGSPSVCVELSHLKGSLCKLKDSAPTQAMTIDGWINDSYWEKTTMTRALFDLWLISVFHYQ